MKVVALAVFAFASAYAGEAPGGSRVQPELVPASSSVPLEPAVAVHLQRLEQEVAALLADPGASAPARGAAFGELGRAAHAYELWDMAAASYRNARLYAPADDRWTHLLAEVYARTGRLEDARREHQAVLSRHPRDLPSLVGLGEACLGLNRLEDAERAFRTALAVAPDSAAAYAGLARVGIARRRYAEARDALVEAIRLAPDATRLRYELAMALRGLGDRTGAAAELARAGTVGVRVADPLLDAVLELRQGARPRLVRARLAYENGRFAEAEEEFAAAVAADPRNVPALVGLGTTLARRSRTDAAIEAFRRALDVDPKNAAAHFNLATLAAARGDRDEAAVHFRAVLDVRPDDREAAAGLASVLERPAPR